MMTTNSHQQCTFFHWLDDDYHCHHHQHHHHHRRRHQLKNSLMVITGHHHPSLHFLQQYQQQSPPQNEKLFPGESEMNRIKGKLLLAFCAQVKIKLFLFCVSARLAEPQPIQKNNVLCLGLLVAVKW